MRKIIQVFILSSVLFFSGSLLAQQKYALIVGINKYYSSPGVLYPRVLQGCVNDGLAIQSLLQRKFGFNNDNIITLFDEQASKKNVLNAFENIIGKIKADDAFVFFFSGHGVWMTNNDQSKIDQAIKAKMNQAMLMSDLYANNLDCLFTDGLLKKTMNRFVDKRAVVTGIFDCCYSGLLLADVNPMQPNPYYWEEIPGEQKSFPFISIYGEFAKYCNDHPDSCQLDHLNDSLRIKFLPEEDTRSLQMGASITINNSEHVTPPAERPQSNFASIAGTDDRTKGLEIMDETGTYHGAFTRALMYVLEKNSYRTPLADILKQTDAILKKQLYEQEPVYLKDTARLSKNFLGIAPIGFSDVKTAQCDDIGKSKVNIKAGTNDGIRPGNILSATIRGNKIVLKIDTAAAGNSVARPVSGNINLLKKGNQLTVVNSFVQSPPVIKVFIEDGTMNTAAFQQLLSQKLVPLTKLDGYWDYENWYNQVCYNILFNRKTSSPSDEERRASIIKTGSPLPFIVYLPIPSNITSVLKKAFAKNQNFKLVQNESEADFSLILNYTKKDPGYVFTWANITNEGTIFQYKRFNRHNVKLKTLPTTEAQLKKLASDIISIAAPVSRGKSNQWFNEYELK